MEEVHVKLDKPDRTDAGRQVLVCLLDRVSVSVLVVAIGVVAHLKYYLIII